MTLMTKSILATAAAGFLFATAQAGACTKAEAQAKADTVSARLQAIAKNDPNRLKTVVPKVEKASQRLRAAMDKNPNDLTEICKYLDEVLAEMN